MLSTQKHAVDAVKRTIKCLPSKVWITSTNSAIHNILALEKVPRETNLNRFGLLYHKSHKFLAYTDDIKKELVKRLEIEEDKRNLFEEIERI